MLISCHRCCCMDLRLAAVMHTFHSGSLRVQMIKEAFSGGPQEIEDLWLPFFCVSTNLSKAQVQVHQLGSLWQFVRASMTIVGLIPPVIHDNEMLVDGGYLNNQPVDVMHSLGVHNVLVVRA